MKTKVMEDGLTSLLSRMFWKTSDAIKNAFCLISVDPNVFAQALNSELYVMIFGVQLGRWRKHKSFYTG